MFVKSHCEKCGGHIEFEYEHKGETIDCPHCRQTTALIVPEYRPELKPKREQEAALPKDLTKATPKQVAFLTFLGFQEAEGLSKLQASELIENLDSVENPELSDRRSEWHTERLRLY